MLLQSLRALCLAPVGSGSVWKYLEALVRSPGVSGRIACGFRTELHFANARCISKLARSRPPILSPNSLDYGLHVCTIMASKCISPNSLDHGLQVHLQSRSITASGCVSKRTRTRPPIVSPNSLDYGLQVRTIMASKVHISKLCRSRPLVASANSLDHGLPVHLQTQSIAASNYISKHARLRPPSASLNSLESSLKVHL